MFDGPEYASYIALCRELRLDMPQGGYSSIDLAVPADPVDGDRVVRMVSKLRYGIEYVRVPRLDQWLAMLEEAGVGGVTLRRWRNAYIACIASGYVEDVFPTREEAAARLWMAVAGRS